MTRKALAKPIQHRLEAALAYAAFSLFRVLPVTMASAVGGKLAELFGPLSRAQLTAQRNLALALPDMTDRERRATLKNVWNNFGRVMAEYATLSRLWRGGKGYVEVDGLHFAKEIANADAPVIMFSAHIGNWEVSALTIGWAVTPPSLVYRAPNNPLIEDLLRHARGSGTGALIQKGAGGAREIIRVLKEGGFVQMAVDQKMNTGVSVPFFGRDAMTGDAVARLALKYGCALLPAHSERVNGCHFRVTYEQPWFAENTGDTEEDVKKVLLKINQTIEGWVRNQPGQWLWLHNRWPRDEVKN